MSSWSKAFAVQAQSDYRTYELLASSTLPACHRLHYLQMWLEKLCKAYLYMPQIRQEELQNKQNVIAGILPRLIAQHWSLLGFPQRPDMMLLRQVCREIDLLHPQIDNDGHRPENVEYPWIDKAGNIRSPAEWSFSLAQRLYSSTGKFLLKAAVRLTENPDIYAYRFR